MKRLNLYTTLIFFVLTLILYTSAKDVSAQSFCSQVYSNPTRPGTNDLCICTGNGGKIPTGGYYVWSKSSTGNTPSKDPAGNTMCEGCESENCYYLLASELYTYCTSGWPFISQCASVQNVPAYSPNRLFKQPMNKRTRAPIHVNPKSK